eukprot:scaffold23394_cov42-Cyclotella_meneghiniana.AAC.1
MPSILQRLPAMSTITTLLLLYCYSCCSIIVTAAKINCCHPTKYTFSLNLSSDCSTNDIADNNGISESSCFVETNVDQSNGRRHQHDTSSSSGSSSGSNGEEPVRRTLQKSSSSIIEVISIQFLEFDTSNQLNVIYTDETYVTAEMVDGDTFEFTSMSVSNHNGKEGEEEVGGASLILYGVNSMGDVVRNRFFWLFDTNNCNGEESVMDGDEIGWVIVEDVKNNCQTNSNTPSPTYSFFTDDNNNGSITTTTSTSAAALTPSAADTPFPTPVVDLGDDATAGETDDTTLGNDDTNGKPNDDQDGRNDDDGIQDDDTYNNSHSSSKSGKKGYDNTNNSKAGKTTNDAKTHKFFHDDGGKSGKTHGKSGKSSGKAFKGGDYDYDNTSAEDYPRGMKFFVKSMDNVR